MKDNQFNNLGIMGRLFYPVIHESTKLSHLVSKRINVNYKPSRASVSVKNDTKHYIDVKHIKRAYKVRINVTEPCKHPIASLVAGGCNDCGLVLEFEL